MKSFTSYLTETKKNYSFKICIAHDIEKECIDKIKMAVDAYKVEKISQPKRLPIQRSTDFPSLGAVQINHIDLITEYPATPQEVAVKVIEALGLSASHVVVRTALQGDQPVEYHAGKSLLQDPELKGESSDGLTTVDQMEALMKEFQSMAMQYAAPNKEKAKTTNDLPQGAGSVLNKSASMPEVKSAAR